MRGQGVVPVDVADCRQSRIIERAGGAMTAVDYEETRLSSEEDEYPGTHNAALWPHILGELLREIDEDRGIELESEPIPAIST